MHAVLHSMPMSLRLAAGCLVLAAGCTTSVTALETIDASVDAVTYVEPDAGMIANLCAHPDLFEGAVVALTVTGIQRTTPSCTAVACGGPDGGGADGGGIDTGAHTCCNDCTAYWVLPCPGGGQLGLVGNDFWCQGSECSLNCTLSLLPSDTVSLHATAHSGGLSGSCCSPIRAGLEANATLTILDYTVTTLPDS